MKCKAEIYLFHVVLERFEAVSQPKVRHDFTPVLAKLFKDSNGLFVRVFKAGDGLKQQCYNDNYDNAIKCEINPQF